MASALKSALSSARNSIKPEDVEEYEAVATGLWNELGPDGPVEEMIVLEVVRATWRLRRCAAMEHELLLRSDIDPMLDEKSASAQESIDQARAQAHAALHGALNDLRAVRKDGVLRRGELPAAQPAEVKRRKIPVNKTDSTLVH